MKFILYIFAASVALTTLCSCATPKKVLPPFRAPIYYDDEVPNSSKVLHWLIITVSVPNPMDLPDEYEGLTEEVLGGLVQVNVNLCRPNTIRDKDIYIYDDVDIIFNRTFLTKYGVEAVMKVYPRSSNLVRRSLTEDDWKIQEYNELEIKLTPQSFDENGVNIIGEMQFDDRIHYEFSYVAKYGAKTLVLEESLEPRPEPVRKSAEEEEEDDDFLSNDTSAPVNDNATEQKMDTPKQAEDANGRKSQTPPVAQQEQTPSNVSNELVPDRVNEQETGTIKATDIFLDSASDPMIHQLP